MLFRYNLIKRIKLFLIKSKRESCYFNEPVFSIDVNKLSKEDLLIDLSLHFDTKIVISYERYERYDCYLSDKIMNDCFTVGFELNTFFYVLKDFKPRVKNLKIKTNALFLSDSLIERLVARSKIWGQLQ